MSQISHSRVQGYLDCRRKEFYGYNRSLRKVQTSDSLFFGSAVHSVLEVYYKVILDMGGKGKTAEVLKAQQQSTGYARTQAMMKVEELYRGDYDDIEGKPNLRRTMERYFDEAEPFVSKGYRVLAIEKEFSLEYDEDTESEFRFIVDLLLEDPDGYYVVVDHKTTYDWYSEIEINMNGQIPKYIGALRGIGYKVAYGIYNFIRTRPMAGDKMLKPQLVIAVNNAIIDGGGFPESDYDKPVEKLTVAALEEIAESYGIVTKTEPEWTKCFQTVEFKPTATRVARTFEEQVAVGAEIQARELLPLKVLDKTSYRSLNKKICEWCEFQQLCEAELSGVSTKLLLETEYETKPKRDKAEKTQIKE